MLDIVGLYSTAREKMSRPVDNHNVGEHIAEILNNNEELSESDIEKSIIGLSGQGIYDISYTGNYLQKYEILIDCPEGLDKEQFLRKVYEQGKSFCVLRRVISLYRELTSISNEGEELLRNRLDLDSNISINVHPLDFLHPDFGKLLDHGFGGRNNLGNLTLELLEENIAPNLYPNIGNKIKEYKEMYRFQLALDDFDGSTEMIGRYMAFGELLDYVKIDKDFFRANMYAIKRYTDIFQKNAQEVIVEGVKHTEHLVIMEKLGINLGQGNYLCKRSKI